VQIHGEPSHLAPVPQQLKLPLRDVIEVCCPRILGDVGSDQPDFAPRDAHVAAHRRLAAVRLNDDDVAAA
jgi:hypothetical protein